MPRTLSDAETTKVKRLIDKTVEPAVKKVVDAFNKEMATHGIQVGCELTWYMEITEEPKAVPNG